MVTYQSKFGRGDEVWFMHKDKATQKPVSSVMVVSAANQEVTYSFRNPDPSDRTKDWLEKTEAEVFATKEELLASL